jgi:hypothetical protein
MFSDFLKKNIKSQASYPEVGFGQVEPNHLSAQYTGQIYAQLPANKDIEILEQGQFVKYDYAKEEVNFTGAGEWMLVYNETKLYREGQWDCEFAMIKDHYQARVYSPLDGTVAQEMYGPTRFLQGKREEYDPATGTFKTLTGELAYDEVNKKWVKADAEHPAADYSFAAKYHDYYEMDDVNNPELVANNPDAVSARLFMKLRDYKEKMMPAGTSMVPRVFKTNVGDIFTTNMINATELAVGATLKVGEKGILEPGTDDKMTWQVVKVYTMPDHQRGVKIMRIV